MNDLDLKSNNWISINDKSPLTNERVLAYGLAPLLLADPDVFTAVFINEPSLKWYSKGEYLSNVTHWMPLPEPPKPENL